MRTSFGSGFGDRLEHLSQWTMAVFSIESPKGPGRSFVLLGKSFLTGCENGAIKCLAQQSWIFGIADVFWYEHSRKSDELRLANLVKIKSIESSLVQLPGIGEMLRAESTGTSSSV